MSQDKKNVEKILIIDDVDANRFVLRDIIMDMGYQPVLAENGVQGLKIINHLWPGLIISDIAMPEMDGYELCETLKRDPKTRDIPIIFISAFDNPEDVVKGFSIGGEDYITKPFLPEVVKARVGLHIKLYETKRELSEKNRLLQASINEQLRQIELEKKNVLYALTRVARENAAYDERHMERICHNCRILSEAMQLSSDFSHLISDNYIETMELAAPLCDLGNVAIPTDILQKEEPLSAEDTNRIQKHTEIGAKILNDVKVSGDYNDFLQMSYNIALYHHENYDGSGYPCGKKGDEIPLSAQIVSVVSDFCAITEKRVYRESYNKEEAIEMMEEYVGIKYNPKIFNILKMIIRQMD